MSNRLRVVVAALAGLSALVLSIAYGLLTHGLIEDLFFPLCGAERLLAHVDPYGGTCLILVNGHLFPPNPMTTILVAVPFTVFGPLAPFLLWACMNALLTYGLLFRGEWWRLLIFLSLPYLNSFVLMQWSPLLTALMFLPSLMPLALLKPHTGLPIILTNLTPKRILGCVLFLLVSLVIDPTWPLRWWPQAQSYDGFIPLLLFPFGLVILLALLRSSDRRAWFLLLMAGVPQRLLYDLLLLWTLADSLPKMLFLLAVTWVGYGVFTLFGAFIHMSEPVAIILVFYVPALALVLLPLRSRRPDNLILALRKGYSGLWTPFTQGRDHSA